MLRTRARRAGLIVLALLAVAGCSQPQPQTQKTQTIKITDATGHEPTTRLTHVTLQLDNCNPHRSYTVATTENTGSVTFTVTGPVWTGEAQAACSDGTTVTLPRPLGRRTIIDGSTGRAVTLTRRAPALQTS